MVGFEPTNTGATTQGLNHLTTPTTSLFSLTAALLLVQRSVTYSGMRLHVSLSRLALSGNNFVVCDYFRLLHRCSSFKVQLKNGDRERARTVDLQRDRLAF